VIYLAENGSNLGPFSAPAVASFQANGLLGDSMHFWQAGQESWLPVSQLRPPANPTAIFNSSPAPIVVLGMHRSGTSCLAGFLQASGVFFGSPSSFKARAGAENPKGFWERRDVRKICDTLLYSAGLDWDQVAEFDPAQIRAEVLVEQRTAFGRLVNELDAQGVWALKEPRLCLLLPLLADLAPTAIILHIHRHPASVAASLAARNNFPLPYGLALWETYNSAALRATQGRKVHRISYEGLVGRPRETSQWLRAILHDQHGIDLSELSDEALEEVIDPALARSSVPPEEGDRWLNGHQAELLAVLRSPSEAPEPPAANPLCLETLRACEPAHATATLPSQRAKVPPFGRQAEDASITLIDAAAVHAAPIDKGVETVVIMPSITEDRALETARLLVKQAGMRTRVYVVMDRERQGFVKTFNDTAARLSATYVVYLAEDVYPGRRWLKLARDKLQGSGKGLLAVNDGKWRGRIASYGMVRAEWAKQLYGGPLLYSGYRNHVADNELTIIARALGQFVYEPDSVLVEIDQDKAFQGAKVYDKKIHPPDRVLLRERFDTCFEGLAGKELLEPLRAEYFR
jgi:hypothetical protein